MKFSERYNDFPKPLRKGKYPFIICMISLGIVMFAVFYVGINIQSILMAFRRFEGYGENGNEIYSWTLENFGKMFDALSGNAGDESQRQLALAFKNTLLLYVCGNAVTFPMGWFVSYYFWKKMKGHKFFRIVFYIFPQRNNIVLGCLIFCHRVFNVHAKINNRLGKPGCI